MPSTQSAAQLLWGSSIYITVDGPSWANAEDAAKALGGHLVSIGTKEENDYLYGELIAQNVGTVFLPGPTLPSGERYWGAFWIGLTDDQQEGTWKWVTDEQVTYTNWEGGVPGDDAWGGQDYAVLGWQWNNSWDDNGGPGSSWIDGCRGIAEIPITSSINLPTTIKEGAGFFTTSINLSAGTQSTGNLAEGVTVHWKVTGITADDLGSGALTGSGVISNGKLDIQHSLLNDSDVGERFEVSVYSDPLMTVQIGSIQAKMVQEYMPIIQGNSLYTFVDGSSWSQAAANSQSLGGTLVGIETPEENSFLVNHFGGIAGTVPFPGRLAYIGLNDIAQENNWRWADGVLASWLNWANNEPNNAKGLAEEDASVIHLDGLKYGIAGVWNDVPVNYSEANQGIAEIPLFSTITVPSAPKEGAGVFTTSINLTAGTQSTGNLAEGAQIWWKVTGITADDLASGALTGSGLITNGKLDIQHSLLVDGDVGEHFEVSAYSDPLMTQQIASKTSVAISEGLPTIRGNSLYTFKDGVTWKGGEDYAISIGGHLASLSTKDEEGFLRNKFIRGWIGFTDQENEGIWKWSDGTPVTHTNWDLGQPDNAGGVQDYAQVWTSNGRWDDAEEDTQEQATLFTKRAIIEVPLELAVNIPTTIKEGAGVFTTSINLTAGTQSTGNLAEGAIVHWRITGITADDLASGALTGSGVITNGRLDIQHSLKTDNSFENERFEVAVYTDALMTAGCRIADPASMSITDSLRSTVIRGNSLYTTVDGPKWIDGEANAVALGGHLASISSLAEDIFLQEQYRDKAGSGYTPRSQFRNDGFWIGLNDALQEGTWLWSSGENGTYRNINTDYSDAWGGQDYMVLVPLIEGEVNGPWYWDSQNPHSLGYDQTEHKAIAEIPITSSINLPTIIKEGAGFFTTTINLTAGTQSTENLAEGATVYWKVTGITADDLASGSLTGSGIIAGGKLELQHSLIVDQDAGERFEASVFSDSLMTQQIGSTASTVIQESDTIPPTVTRIAVQGTTVILTFSEAVTALSVPATAFAVQTVSSNNTATNRTITNVALDQNDATKVILNLSGTAPASNVNLRVSYTAPGTNQTTGVVQDISGNDLATFSNVFADTFITAATTTLASQYRNLTLTGTSAVNGTGNALDNRIIGNTNVNVLTGAVGTDVMDGGANGDRYVIVSALDHPGAEIQDTGTTGIDELRFASTTASQTLTVFAGDTGLERVVIGTGTGATATSTATTALSINASAAPNALTLSGNYGVNSLIGTGFNDLINGNRGNDNLTGGLGADTFRFDSTLNATTNRDTIIDFNVGQGDRIELENAVFTGLTTTGVLNANAFVVGTAATTAAHRIIYNSTTGTLTYDSNGNAAGGTTVFAQLGAGLSLTAGMFTVT